MKQTFSLSMTQLGIFVECMGHKGELCYNLPYIYTLDKDIDERRLKEAVETAIKAHPYLLGRVSLNDAGDPVITVDDEATIEVDVCTVDDIDGEAVALTRPFDLLNDCLVRAHVRRTPEHLYLFLDVHHLVADGTTQKLLLNDFEDAYNGLPVVGEEITAGEVAQDEADRRATDDYRADKEWYAAHYDCGDVDTRLIPDVLQDKPYGEGFVKREAAVSVAEVEAYCREHGTFKSNFFTCALGVLLSRYNNEDEAVFTTIYSGRKDKRLAHTAGMFVRTFPIYYKATAETTVDEALKNCRDLMTGCRERDLYAYAELVNDMGVTSNVMLAYQGEIYGRTEFAGLPFSQRRVNNSTLDVPLSIKVLIIGGKYYFKAEYRSNLYTREFVSQLLDSYDAVLKGMMENERVADINIGTQAGLALLDEYNKTDYPYDAEQTIVSLFNRQVEATPGNVAVVYKDKRITYHQLGGITTRLAQDITARGLGRGDVVSVLIPRCEYMAIASLGALKAGCAYQPLDPSYPAERLNFMVKDADARLLIAHRDLIGLVDEYDGPVLFIDEIPSLPERAEVTLPQLSPDDLFILLYTSGSTGTPKGCQLEHGNLVAYCDWYARNRAMTSTSRAAAYASYGFDACMLDLYPALTTGAAVHILPEEIRLDLIAINEYMEREGITHGFMTTQVAYQFAASVDNHSLQHFSTGGEKLAVLSRELPYKFWNIYGPTETTVSVTSYCVRGDENDIPIGRVNENVKAYVVDTRGKRQPAGAMGELWVSGPQVGRGYLNRPEKTAEVFIDNPFDDDPRYRRVYRTGDIVRFLPDGNIQFVGRKDGQVKIRGFRIELKEVEGVIREFEGIKDATVQAFDEEGGGKFIAAYVVADKPIDVAALNAFIEERKPPYMVPAVTMQIDVIPLNQNQKVNKRALPKPERKLVAEEAVNVPMNVLETTLHEIIAGVVGHGDFTVATPLGYAGLTSISSIKLSTLLYKRFGVTVDSKSLVKGATLQTVENEILTSLLAGKRLEEEPQVAGEEPDGPFPLSYAQTGVYYDCLKNPGSTIYNVPFMVSMPAGVGGDALERAVRQVLLAHPQLWARFDTVDGEVVQIIAKEREAAVARSIMSRDELDRYKNEFVKPFNLAHAPLYRAEVVETPEGSHLLLDMHHLVTDGASFDLILKQITALLDGEAIEAESYPYSRFVRQEKADEQGEEYKAASEYYAGQFAAFESASEVTDDLKNTGEPGRQCDVSRPIDLDRVDAYCREHGVTVAQFMLAASAYALSRYINSREVYLSTISSGRANVRIADTVGMFVHTLALHATVGDQRVDEFVESTAAMFSATLRHENYPLARLAADYGFKPKISFVYQMGVVSQYQVGGNDIVVEGLELNVPKFKLEVIVREVDGKPSVIVRYDDACYSARLMNGLAASIAAVTTHFLDAPAAPVRSISLLDEESRKVVDAFRVEATSEVPFEVFHHAIERHAVTQPDHLALIACDGTFTYAQFNATANRIAHALIERGVQPRDRVALLLPRTSRLSLSTWGVVKAGAAFIPCDPHYPAERVKHILDDSAARFIITTADNLDNVPAGKGIDVEELLHNTDESNPNVPVTGDDLIYLIYTSGSTGTPKGVMLRHAGLCNYAMAHPANVMSHAVTFDAKVVLAVTTCSFDASMHELAMPLFNGLTIVLANEEQTTDPFALAQLIEQHHVGFVSATPSQWLTWISADKFVLALKKVKVMRCGGEKLPQSLMKQLQQLTPSRIFNSYGPTETTVSSNIKEVTHSDIVTVGRPLLNVHEYIVDADGNELPEGVVGELYIGGAGVGRGYNNLDDKTRERYVTYNNERVYKSGDYAKWLPDGDVVILGRTDNQIKLRGLRIELGEIENVMMKVDGMKTVVIVIRKIGGKEHLCAYYTASRPIDTEALKAEISQSLTQYMVPTAYLQMDKMPVTPNGKTDVKALPEPELAAGGQYEAPATETERVFCDIFADILMMERVGVNDNFFELGGTSLVVTRVIIEADKAGHHVAYGDVFANPTPRQLARLVGGGDAAVAGDDDASNFDYRAIDAMLQGNTLEAYRAGERQPLGTVLLTGATGFLGIHILNELLHSDADMVYCLVRGGDLEQATSRLKALLFYYFGGDVDNAFAHRVRLVPGDVTQDLLSLDDRLKTVNTVFNCAAIVKHFSKGTEIEDVNIGGAQRCVDLCLATGARLVHISTASTRGLSVEGVPAPDEVFTERRLFMGQYLGNKYIYSKFMAERLILQAIATQGLSAKIMRVGNLSARASDGEFQANFATNSFMGRIKVYNMLGCCPHGMRDKRVEFSPIDQVSHAIVLLATTPRECCVFHPYNNHTQLLGDVLKELTSVGDGVRFVEQENFDRVMEEAKADPAKSKLLASLLAYQDMAHGKKTTDVARDNTYTTQVLYRLGHEWSPTAADYADQMLMAIGGLGFFE